MWALEYITTPSLPCTASNDPSDQYLASTEMIECALMDGETGMSCRPVMKGLPGDMLSVAVGTNGLFAAPRLLARSRETLPSWKGSVVSRRARSATIRHPATKLPR